MRLSKTLGAVLFAVLAVGAIAQAASGIEFKAKEYPVRVLAKQKTTHEFKIGSSEIKCTEASFSSAEPEFLKEKSTTILLSATYGKCTAFGLVEATVKMEGCLYLLMTSTETEGTVDIKGHGGTNKTCEEKPILLVAKAVGCEVTVGVQSGLKTATYKNESGKVLTTFSISKIAYHSNEKGAGCPKNGEEATYKGEVEAEGFNERGESDGIEVGNTEPPTVTFHEGSTTGTAVPTGTTLVGKSTNFVIHMASGNVDCTGSTLEGTLESNKTQQDKLKMTASGYSGCTTTFTGKPTATITAGTLETATVAWWSMLTKAWWLPFIPHRMMLTLSSGPKCTYNGGILADDPTEGPPLIAKIVDHVEVSRESGEAPCEASAELSGEYTIKTAAGKELAVTTP